MRIEVNPGPVILIGGVARIGKTRLAKKLAALTRFDLIHCDRLRRGFWWIADEQERFSERLRSYVEAIAGRRGGLIVEGDDLIARNRGDTNLASRGLISNDRRLSLALLDHLRKKFEAKAFVVGRMQTDPASVVAAIRRDQTDRSLMTTFSDRGMKSYILRSLQRSAELRIMAAEGGISYLELGGDDFEGSIEAAVMRILDELNWPITQDAGQSPDHLARRRRAPTG